MGLDYWITVSLSHLCFKQWSADISCQTPSSGYPELLFSNLNIYASLSITIQPRPLNCSRCSPSIKDLNTEEEGSEVGPDYATTGILTLCLSVLCHPGGARSNLMRPLSSFNQGEYIQISSQLELDHGSTKVLSTVKYPVIKINTRGYRIS